MVEIFQFLILCGLAGIIKAGLTCSENETYIECLESCPSTCQKPNPPQCYFFRCQESCVCKSGFIRDKTSKKCLPFKECAKVCEENQEYRDAGPGCPITCKTPNPIKCSQTSGCFCKTGFCYDDSCDQCVKIEP